MQNSHMSYAKTVLAFSGVDDWLVYLKRTPHPHPSLCFFFFKVFNCSMMGLVPDICLFPQFAKEVCDKYTNILKFSMGQVFPCELNMHYLLIFIETLWIWLSPLRYEKLKTRILSEASVGALFIIHVTMWGPNCDPDVTGWPTARSASDLLVTSLITFHLCNLLSCTAFSSHSLFHSKSLFLKLRSSFVIWNVRLFFNRL